MWYSPWRSARRFAPVATPARPPATPVEYRVAWTDPGSTGSTRDDTEERARRLYVVLPAAKLYQPIWTYDVKTLADDLSAHLVYGLVTAAAWRLA